MAMVSLRSTAAAKRETASSICAKIDGSGSRVFNRGSRNSATEFFVTPRDASNCASAPLNPESSSSRAAPSSKPRIRHTLPLSDEVTPKAKPAPGSATADLRPKLCASASTSMVERMAHLDPAHRARCRTHHDGIRRHIGGVDVHAFEHGTIGHARGGEHHIARSEVGEAVFAIEVANAEALGAQPLVIVTEREARLELAADTAQRRRGEHAFGRTPLPHIDIHTGDLRLGGGDDAGHVAIGNKLNRCAGSADAGDDLLVTGPVENQRADVLRLDVLRPGEREN